MLVDPYHPADDTDNDTRVQRARGAMPLRDNCSVAFDLFV